MDMAFSSTLPRIFSFFVFVKINNLKNLIFLKYVKQKESNIKSNELEDSFWKKVVR
jgi:hypothetical protein